MTILWAPLIAKAVATALLVVCAAALAEAFGPFWGALIASLPISAGPAYIFLAMAHGSEFLAASALNSFAANAGTGAFLVVYALTVRRLPSWWGLGLAITTWLIASALIRQFTWTPITALGLNLIVFAAGLLAAGRPQPARATAPTSRHPLDLPLRATVIALFVCAVVLGSSVFGPQATGVVAVFPISLGSLIVMLQPRLGRQAASDLAVTALRSMFGFGLALLTLHEAIRPWGAALALLAALLVTLAWSAMLLALRHRITPGRPARHAAI